MCEIGCACGCYTLRIDSGLGVYCSDCATELDGVLKFVEADKIKSLETQLADAKDGLTAAYMSGAADYKGLLMEADEAKDELNSKLMISEAENQLWRNRQRPVIRRFAGRMEWKLKQNDHKGGWKRCRPVNLYERLVEECQELYDAIIEDKSHLEIQDEAADVANFAMMIQDAYETKADTAARARLEQARRKGK